VAALRASIFNDVVWPDFTRLPVPQAPVLRVRSLEEHVEQEVGGLWVTPVAVTHTVPTSGFVVHDGAGAMIYSGDTGPTEALWRAARAVSGLRAIILECSFPNRLGGLAEIARHLTPALLHRELDKLPADVPVLIFHVKPQFHDEIGEELGAVSQASGARITMLEQDKTYVFSPAGRGHSGTITTVSLEVSTRTRSPTRKVWSPSAAASSTRTVRPAPMSTS
jgi:cAMP phosphodiesterase